MGSEPHPEATHVTRRFGRYLVLEELGRGSYGVVYLARPQEGGDPVAIKVLLQADGDQDAVARFQQEASIAARLSHPGLVRVYEAGWQQGHPWMAMEYCPGPTLQQRLRDQGPLPPADAAQLLAEVARAVAHAHDQGVVHRDLKPSNVILDERTGRPRLTDFGLARDRALGVSITATGEALGTPYYMSPEQVRAQRDLDARSDVWALGVILYECLTGKRPFDGRSSFLVAQQIIQTDPTPPSRLREGIAPALEAVCLRCLRKERAERYTSAGALAFALEAAAGASLPSLLADGSLVLPLARTPGSPSRLAIGLAAALLAVGGGAGGALVAVRRARAERAEAPSPGSQGGASGPDTGPEASLGPEERRARVEELLQVDPSLPLAELLRRADHAAALATAGGQGAGSLELQAKVTAWRADRLYRRGRTQEVLTVLQPLLGRGDRVGLEARFLLALALHDQGQDEAAEREFDGLARDDPRGALGLAAMARAECIRSLGVGAEVLPRAAELEPDGWQVQLTWAWSLMRRGQLEEADEIVDRLLAARPDDVGVWMARMGVAERRGDQRGEAEALEKALAIGESDPPRLPLLRRAGQRLMAALALAEEGGQRFSDALNLSKADVSALLRRRPEDVDAMMIRAITEIVERRGTVEASTAAVLQQALVLDRPGFIRRAVSMGSDAGDALLQIAGWRIVPPPAPGQLAPPLRARLAQRAEAAFPQARASLLTALETAAGGAPPAEVVQVVERVVGLARGDPIVALEAARILCGRDAPGALEAVEAALQALGQLDPARQPRLRAELLRLKGEALVRRGRQDDALAALELAAAADPKGPEGLCAAAAKAWLDMIRAPRGNDDEGESSSRQARWAMRARAQSLAGAALDASPDHAGAQLLLATMTERWSPISTIARLERVFEAQGHLDAQASLTRASAMWELLAEGGKVEQAREELLRAADLSLGPWPRYRAGYRALGGRDQRGADLEFAEQMAQEALALQPDFGQALQLQGMIRMRRGAGKDEVLELWRAAQEHAAPRPHHRWLEEFQRKFGDDPLLDALRR